MYTYHVCIALVLSAVVIESSVAEPVPNSGDRPTVNLRGSESNLRKLRVYVHHNRKSGGGIGGFFAGILIWCLIPPCLWNNERIAIKQAKLQTKARHATVIIDSIDVDPIPPLEGHIVFASGKTVVAEELKDKYVPSVKATNCIKLRRIVEMYQWVEKEKTEKRGDEEIKIYYYEKEWKDEKNKHEHDTAGEHKNPEMTLPSSKRSKEAYQGWAALSNGNGEECAMAKNVKFGKYYCGEFVVRELTNWKDKSDVTTSQMSSLTDSGVRNKGGPKQQDKWFMYGSGTEIGDYRIRFEQLECGPLSVNGCLAKTKRGYTFVPIIHEDSAMSESICTEFGLDCGSSSGVRYTGPQQQQDSEFINKLDSIGGSEMRDNEKAQFQREDSTADIKDYTDDGKGDMCCTCCVSQDRLVNVMHYVGLEEEYLGVKEESVQHQDMMGQEKAAADRRHNCCRMVGLLMGVLGAWLFISPVTNLLTANALIACMGGALISCALQIIACCCSSISVTVIIAAAWVRHRPRAVIICLVVVLGIWAGIFSMARASGGTNTVVGATVAPGVAATAAPVGATIAPAFTALATTAAPIMADGAPGSTCASYIATCPPGHTKKVPTTQCATNPCAWSDCCAQTTLKRRLQAFT